MTDHIPTSDDDVAAYYRDRLDFIGLSASDFYSRRQAKLALLRVDHPDWTILQVQNEAARLARDH